MEHKQFERVLRANGSAHTHKRAQKSKRSLLSVCHMGWDLESSFFLVWTFLELVSKKGIVTKIGEYFEVSAMYVIYSDIIYTYIYIYYIYIHLSIIYIYTYTYDIYNIIYTYYIYILIYLGTPTGHNFSLKRKNRLLRSAEISVRLGDFNLFSQFQADLLHNMNLVRS